MNSLRQEDLDIIQEERDSMILPTSVLETEIGLPAESGFPTCHNSGQLIESNDISENDISMLSLIETAP